MSKVNSITTKQDREIISMKKEFEDIKDEAKRKLTKEEYNLLKSRLDKLEYRFNKIEKDYV